VGFAKSVYDRMPGSVQEGMVSFRGWQLRRRRFSASYRDFRRMFRVSEAGGLEELQARLLRVLIKRAARDVPYYRDIFEAHHIDPDSIRSAADLTRLPVLTKDAVRAHKQSLISETYPRRRLLYGHTSGSTGSSLTLYWDHNVDIAWNAALWRHREWAGVPFGTPYASLLGQVIVPATRTRPPFWRRNHPWNQTFFSTFHLRDENLDAYVAELERSGAQALEAYPSTAYVLARHLEQRNRTLPLRAVFTSTETLLDTQRELIEERFACRVFDYYSAAERVIFAGECEEHRGLHLFDDVGVTEVLDDDDRPVPPGQPGRLVVTGLHNFAMPFIRYEIGDVSGISTEPCSCGRSLPLLLRVTTKSEDILVLPDGRYIAPSVLTHPFKPLKTVRASQIIQETPDLVRVLLVTRDDYGPRDEQRLRASLVERLGTEVTLRIEQVDEIPRGPRGKLRWVISKVPLRFGSDRTQALQERGRGDR